MEDSQRNISAPLTDEPTQRWTLMFIGDKGQVVTIRRFKGVAVAVSVLVLILALVSISLFFFYRRPARENADLKIRLARAEQTISELGFEKDRLTAQLVMIKSKLTPAEPETTDAASAAASTPATEDVQPSPASVQAPAPPPEPPKMVMAVENLQTERDSQDDSLRIRFTLKNVNEAIKPARGRTFVILDPDDGSPERYLSYPRTSMVNGKPESWRSGRYFSINRFNIIRFKTTETLNPALYSEARVLVYSQDGDLIMDKLFSVVIPEPKPKPVVPAVTDGPPPSALAPHAEAAQPPAPIPAAEPEPDAAEPVPQSSPADAGVSLPPNPQPSAVPAPATPSPAASQP